MNENAEMDQLIEQLSPEVRELWLKSECLMDAPPEVQQTADHRAELADLGD